MCAWSLPKLESKENRDVKKVAKDAVSYIDGIAGVLTCLSCEAKQNDLTSMAFVLTELANGLVESTNRIECFIRHMEMEEEKEKNK
jgi:hypothetical protein